MGQTPEKPKAADAKHESEDQISPVTIRPLTPQEEAKLPPEKIQLNRDILQDVQDKSTPG